LPPTIYADENGNEYVWNELENKFQTDFIPTKNNIINASKATVQKFINESIIWKYFKINPENNLDIMIDSIDLNGPVTDDGILNP
jgi:hypothetical protein